MPGPTVRISARSHHTLRELSAETGESMQSVIDKAVETYRRQKLLEDINIAYAALRADHSAWADLQAERDEWDSTLQDGLEPEEHSDVENASRRPYEGEP